MHARKLLIATLLAFALPAAAADKTAEVHTVTADGIGEKIGTVTFVDSADGLVITPDLSQLSPGAHGFHIHQKPSCATATKDGKISREEFNAARQARSDKHFQRLDANSDGFIDKSERMAAVGKKCADRHRHDKGAKDKQG